MMTEDRNSEQLRIELDEQLRIEKERAYQRQYYIDHREECSAHRKHKRATDPEFRRKEIERSRNRRAKLRDRNAKARLERRVQEKQKSNKAMRSRRWAMVESEAQWVYGTAMVGQEVGRDPVTIRVWLSNGVLPGCSVWVGRRAFFSEKFITAVRQACIETLRFDGHGSHEILRRKIRESLEKSEVPFVPRKRKG